MRSKPTGSINASEQVTWWSPNPSLTYINNNSTNNNNNNNNNNKHQHQQSLLLVVMRCWIDFNCINVLFASSFYISCFDKFCYLETFPSFLLLFTLHYTSRRSFMNPNPRPSSYVHYPGNKFTVFCDFVLHHRGKNRRSGLNVSNKQPPMSPYHSSPLNDLSQ